MARLVESTTSVRTCDSRAVTDADLIACLPRLRAFARGLTRTPERADDLVQDTVVHALTAAHQFQAGSNLQSWMFTILRNLRYSELRRMKRVPFQSLDASACQPAVAATQELALEFGDFRRAFEQLGDDQRDALILVGADGLSYEEAARARDCATGTIKSRVSRGRGKLRQILTDDSLTDKRRDTPALAGYMVAS